MKIWVAADSGTWGMADSLYIVDVPDDPRSLDDVDELTDSERSTWAMKNGTPAL